VLTNVLLAAAAFAALALLDWVWAKYIAAVSEGTALCAASWSVPVYALGATMTIQIVEAPWLLVPACAGSFVGTYYSVWQKRRHTNG
jgi:uncharacterized membrane protein YfcA